VALAVTVSAFGMMPAWLVSALAVQIGESFPLTESSLGLAVALFMGTSMVGSVPAGYWVRRVGWVRGMQAVAALGVAANGAMIATTALWQMLALVVVAGAANAVAQPAANLSLVDSVPDARHGTAFGIKQAGTPGAMLVAGVAVPAIGITVGWRWAFFALAVVCGGMAALLLRLRAAQPRPSGARDRATRRLPVPRRRALLVLGLSGCVATAAATSLAAFAVTYGTGRGIGEAASGVIVAVGSLGNVAVRLATGYLADRRGWEGLAVVASTMAFGALGYFILALADSPTWAVAGILIAFTGWGWNGLFHMATMRSFPDFAAPATGAIVAAMAVGGVIGPAAFGLLVGHGSYPTAWLLGGLVTVLGSGLVLVARLLLRRAREPLDVVPVL
jgi:predicted MFS family arabinose efflux permease